MNECWDNTETNIELFFHILQRVLWYKVFSYLRKFKFSSTSNQEKIDTFPSTWLATPHPNHSEIWQLPLRVELKEFSRSTGKSASKGSKIHHKRGCPPRQHRPFSRGCSEMMTSSSSGIRRWWQRMLDVL